MSRHLVEVGGAPLFSREVPRPALCAQLEAGAAVEAAAVGSVFVSPSEATGCGPVDSAGGVLSHLHLFSLSASA